MTRWTMFTGTPSSKKPGGVGVTEVVELQPPGCAPSHFRHHAGPEQGPPEWLAGGVGEHQARVRGRPMVEVLSDDLDQAR